MSKTLSGKVALVTGGSRGLGAAIAAALADQGADVAISYVSSEAKAAAVLEGLKAKGIRAIAIQADQGDSSAAGSLIQKVVEALGKLDILVNNAAVALQGKTIDDPEIDNAAMDRQWAINTFGVIANIRAAPKCFQMADVLSRSARGWARASPFLGRPTTRRPRRPWSATAKARRATSAAGISPSTSFKLA